MLKKIVLVFIVLFILFVASVAVFIANFDANTYKPKLVEQIEKSLGKPVAIEDIALTWDGGIALSMKQFAIFPSMEQRQEPILSVGEANLNVQLIPLLRKQLQVGTFRLIAPKCVLVRNPEGKIYVKGLEPKETRAQSTSVSEQPSPEQTPETAPQGGAGVLVFEEVSIVDGEILLEEWTGGTVRKFKVQDLDIVLKQIAAGKEITLDVDAAVLAQQQNVHFKTSVQLSDAGQPATVAASTLEVVLGNLDLEVLRTQVPQTKPLEALAGTLYVSVPETQLTPDAFQAAQIQARLEGAAVLLDVPHKDESLELKNIQASLKLTPGQMMVEQLRVDLLDGQMKLKGYILEPTKVPDVQLDVELHQVPIEALLPDVDQGKPMLLGKVSSSIKTQFKGSIAEEIVRSLTLEGDVAITEAKIENLNLLREAFSRLSLVPGLVEQLLANLPEDYKQAFEVNETPLRRADWKVNIQKSTMRLSDVKIASDHFGLVGDGTVGLEGKVRFPTQLVIAPTLSEAVIKTAPILSPLTDDYKQLTVPITIKGTLPLVIPEPDVNYLSSRLLAGQAQELIGGEAGAIVGGLLGGLLEGRDS